MATCDFATFAYSGDVHRLHAPGQLERQVLSNQYHFKWVIITYQNCDPTNREIIGTGCPFATRRVSISNIDSTLISLGIDIDKPQYVSPTDKHHQWKAHVINHLVAAREAYSDYIVFADNDCWMIKQSDSWVKRGIEILQTDPTIFIVSPNDGEPSRKTQTMSQQMFLVRTEDFRQADFNQPGWDGNVHVPGGPFPEYWALLEGRMELYCRHVSRYRYVLPPEYRYWHFNRTTQDGQLETDLGKY